MLPGISAEEALHSDEVIRSGPLTLNLSGLAVSVNGTDIPMTQSEFLLLATLARNPYSVMDRERLARVLREGALGPSLNTSVRAVDTHVARIRSKLAKAGCECIATMRNVGYRFVPPDMPAKKPSARSVPPGFRRQQPDDH